jgi:sigma-B regulation protein RsbU (phosphoserine phosphatase)
VREINASYQDNDDTRYLLERSLELSSVEMTALNARLNAERRRLEQELEVAMHLQTSILPGNVSPGGCEIAARMVPATEVGGDYYDIIPNDDGCWIAIGDVAGHGLRAAVVMTMVQSMVSVITRDGTTDVSPRDVVIAINRAIHENVFCRLGTNDHVTFSVMRCHADGGVTFAGAHEPILVFRKRTGACEEIGTPGTWLGPVRDVAPFTANHALSLDPGDIMVLYTDGIIEAMDASRREFGLDRLAEVVVANHAAPVDAICERVIEDVRRWMSIQQDDMTLLLCRRAS